MSVSVALRHRLGDFALDVSFESRDGVTALFGHSGSGKTSLINAIAGLVRPDQGRIQIGDRVLFDAEAGIFMPPHKRRVGYVFQEARLFPHLSVQQNLEYGQRMQRASVPTAPIIDLLGLTHLLKRVPRDLSGGEAQRVAIGRALLCQPDILLMDEPLAALDAARKAEILPYLQQLGDHTDTPIFYVSHAMAEVAQLANDLIVLREGKVVQSGPLEHVLADPFAIADLGVREAGAILSVTVARQNAGDGLSALSTSVGTLYLPRLEQPEGAKLRLRVRASDVILSTGRPEGLSALNILECKIAAIHEGQGPGVALALTSGTDKLVARITRRSAQAMGLQQGGSCYAVVKTVSIAPVDVGGSRPINLTKE